MPSEAAQTAPIAVYGATGFTGRLVAAELRRRGADFVLSGRNPAKLEILAEEVGGGTETKVARLDDPASLRDLLEPCSVVISCAGPFQLHGEPVLAAAVESGTHYLDTTGEQPFMRTVFERYGDAAERAGVALVTAMGFDYVPGDMIAALTAGSGPVDEVALAYWVKGFGPTRGTALSALGMMGGGDVNGAPESSPRGRSGSEGERGTSEARSASSGWSAIPPVSTSRCRSTWTRLGSGPCSARRPRCRCRERWQASS